MASRSYTGKQLKMLIALTGNECEYRGCSSKLVTDNNIFLGEIAHIAALNPSYARYDENMTDEQRNGNENLMVLCRNHHALIDKDVSNHPVKLLIEMKAEHEEKVKEQKKEYAPDDKIVTAIITEITGQQTNINSGSGTQINQQNFYNTPQELADHVRLIRRNVRLASEGLRRLLRQDDISFNQLSGLLNRIVIDGVYAALEDDDLELFQICIDELKRVSSFCFEENTHNLKRSQHGTYLEIIKFIVNSCYEIGSYCIDNQKFAAIRRLALSVSPIGLRPTSNWLYTMTSKLYKSSSYQAHGIYQEALDYIKDSIASRMGWTDLEADINLQQFEFLANLYQFYENGKHDFPLHSAYYEKNDINKLIEKLINDNELLKQALPNVNRAKLSEAIVGLDEFAGEQAGIGSGYHSGFGDDTIIKKFIERYESIDG